MNFIKLMNYGAWVLCIIIISILAIDFIKVEKGNKN
ncbi:MAG: hypothetical protein K0Q97_1059 [Bacillota bacterium]|jgi:hypothetical protein|nr:hypothetical protein [Bacillota bacterium]